MNCMHMTPVRGVHYRSSRQHLLRRGLCWTKVSAFVGCFVLASSSLVALPQSLDAAGGGRVATRASASLVRQHRPGAWSVLSVQASNPLGKDGKGTDGEGMVSVYFPDTVDKQYVRRLWVPAGGRRNAFLPFRMPAGLPPSDSSIELQMATITLGEDSREVFQRREGDPLTETILLSVDHEPVKTMALYRRNPIDERQRTIELDADAGDLLHVARQAAKLSTMVTRYEEDFLPPWPEALEQFHTILLCGDRLLHDSAGLAALRSWLRDGGRLWIMLDKTPPSMLTALLGNRLDLREVDRVELDLFEIESINRRTGEVTVDACDFERPVEFVRVATAEDDVTSRINGWPATIWLPYGEGEVLVTTLGPRGWMTEFDERPTEALTTMMTRFFSVPEGKLEPKIVEDAVTKQIGYTIPSRSFAIGLLAACCGGLGAAGLVLARNNRLQHFAWIAPLIAVTAAGVFVATGVANSTSVPPSVAALEIQRVIPQSNELRIEGMAAIYDPRSRQVSWDAGQRQWAVPLPASDGEVRRLVWRDDDELLPENFSTAAGSVGTTRLRGGQPSAKPIGVSARFGADGIEGWFSAAADGNGALPSAAVIVQTAMPGLALSVAPDGGFVGRSTATLPPGEYAVGSLLSDEEARRHAVLQTLLDPTDPWSFPEEPSLFFWSDDVAMATSFPEDFAAVGAALQVVPLTLLPTPPASPFSVPATFLRPTVESGRTGSSTAYNARTGQWVKGLTRGGETRLRFELPAAVRPCRLDRGTLTLRCNLPSRSLRVWAATGPEPVEVFSRSNPNGVLEIPLSAEHLQLDASGGVHLGIVVGNVETAATTEASFTDDGLEPFEDTGWQIDYAWLTVDGHTLSASEQP
jgi:hypothetical protein